VRKDHIEILRPFLPSKYSPLQANGDGLQSVYLAEVPRTMADALVALMGQSYYDALALLSAFPTASDADEVDEIEIDGGVSVTFKEQLVKARRGQGVFRSSVLLNEEYCRVTGVSDPRHLRASHIKPWRDSNNAERLHGANGLLLSPHIDHLFDQGYISFSNDEQLLIVSEVRNGLLDAWGIDAGAKIGRFNSEQRVFLDYHRINIFKGNP
jgi:putative restriction endonuclease